MSRYQKGKTNLDFTEARDSEWQWHQLGRMQVCTSLQTDNHTSTPPLSQFFTGRMPFLPPTNSVKALKAVLTYLLSLTVFIERFRAAVSVLIGPCCPALLDRIHAGVHTVVLLGK